MGRHGHWTKWLVCYGHGVGGGLRRQFLISVLWQKPHMDHLQGAQTALLLLFGSKTVENLFEWEMILLEMGWKTANRQGHLESGEL